MKVNLAATQMACGHDRYSNLQKLETLIRQAAAQGANIVLPQEMSELIFFANFKWSADYFAFAETIESSPALKLMRSLAKELGIVIPANFFERAGQSYFNTNVIIDADGKDLGIYRKMHMPLGPPNCFEKFYTSPGDTGFKVFDTAFGRLGCGVCWDQWFPEASRIMALQGADILFFPTAIGSDCHDHWQAAICGHSAANIIPIVVTNRVGIETDQTYETNFWGGSFITDHLGKVVSEAGADEQVILATTDIAENRKARAEWGLFRDRRPDHYQLLMTMDGSCLSH